ncbi:hypothetical protein [Spiroplasma floricola]|uniref:ABC transporter permease n=1 Tax=Spiroplasma floricola 23-6 TaxID=1336749 RepID=A0A2K8SEA2_9MOLU|nr:hypothetical protein [Spiroplasma floricola]AUB31568.1 ABC transporter permease [Spiroplasma floricola 23-6]
MKNNKSINLFKTVLLNQIKNRKLIILTLVSFFLLILIDSISIYLVLAFNDYSQLILINKLIIATSSVLIALLVLIHCSHLFILQKNEGLWKIDLNFGYSEKSIFLSRILLSYFLILVLIISKLLINLIIYLSINKYDSLWAYQFFITPFGWYSIFAFFIPIVVLVFSVLIKSSISMVASTSFTIFILLLPLLTIFFSVLTSTTDFNKNQAFSDALKNQIFYNIKKQIDRDDLSTTIYNENYTKRYIESNGQIEAFIMSGYDEKQINSDKEYWKFINAVESQIDANQRDLLSWNQIQEWSNKTVLIKETPGKIFDKINFNFDSKYGNILNAYKQFILNWNIWRNINEENPKSGILLNPINKYKIEAKTTATKFMFRKSFESMLFNVYEVMQVALETNSRNGIAIANPIVTLQQKQKSYLISNLLNPISHFNLMFNSINYQKNNTFLDYYNYHSIFYAKTYNSKVVGKKGELYLVNKIKPLLDVLFIYLFYFAIGSLIIVLMYKKWKRSLKK